MFPILSNVWNLCVLFSHAMYHQIKMIEKGPNKKLL